MALVHLPVIRAEVVDAVRTHLHVFVVSHPASAAPTCAVRIQATKAATVQQVMRVTGSKIEGTVEGAPCTGPAGSAASVAHLHIIVLAIKICILSGY